MNDLKASQLISQSLSGALSDADRVELQRHLEQSSEAKAFIRLSTLIEQSLVNMNRAEIAQADSDVGIGQRLSAVSKERLRRSIREASRALPAEGLDSQLQVAQAETTYFHGSATELVDDTRQAVARYTLLRKIGQGGLGTVWLARDEKLKRNVALKELNSQSAESHKLWQRFTREAEITGHLEHPNVVPLYLSGVNPESGMPFYAMRFLGKQTLADAIREYHAQRLGAAEDPIHLHRLLNAFLDVCQAIAYAHSRGVIHRDLKPENVALDSFGQVLVLDWGLAKLDSDGELATRLALSGNYDEGSLAQTLDGDVVGTPLYMAPEQAIGELNQLDERTDVYGLGAILFAILTGNAPHENSHRSSSGSLKLKDILHSIAHSETPHPRAINPTIPRDLESICLRAMSKERYARHASAQELASEVESWIAGRHRMQTRYDAMRLTGRDIKSRLCVQIRQLAVTAQFMVELPPIQGLMIRAEPDPSASATSSPATPDGETDELNKWKERLSTVLRALAKTKANLSALSYAQLCDDRICELVRIERSLHDVANIRTLPQSRLRRGAANTFHKMTMEQFPGECHIDFDLSVAGLVRIVAGVPVFDSQTEEPFGLVLAEAEIGNLVRPELEATHTNDVLYLIDDKGRILFSSKAIRSDGIVMAAEAISRWPEIAKSLAESGEYTESDREYYASQLSLPNKNNSLRIVLQIAES